MHVAANAASYTKSLRMAWEPGCLWSLSTSRWDGQRITEQNIMAQIAAIAASLTRQDQGRCRRVTAAQWGTIQPHYTTVNFPQNTWQKTSHCSHSWDVYCVQIKTISNSFRKTCWLYILYLIVEYLSWTSHSKMSQFSLNPTWPVLADMGFNIWHFSMWYSTLTDQYGFDWKWDIIPHDIKHWPIQGAVSIRKTVLPGMAIPMLKIRCPNGRLIFNMEIAIRR